MNDLKVRIMRSRDFMAENFAKPLTLEDAAAEACLSKYHFLRTFSEVVGETPHKYLARRRIQQAKWMLATSDMSISEICLNVGYESFGSFSSRFSQEVGCPPSEFRRDARRVWAIGAANPGLYIPVCISARYYPRFPQF